MNKLFHFQIAVKSVEPQEVDGKKSVLIQGYASTPDIDRYDDIVEPTAFAGALSMFMKNPTLLRSHNPDCPAGHITQARVTDQGLWVEAIVTEEKTVEDVIENRMRAFSIGYRALESALQHRDGSAFNAEKDSPWDKDIIRVIKKIDLVEISIVSTPANGNALFTISQSVKSYFNELVTKSMKLNQTVIENKVIEDEVIKNDEKTEEVAKVEDEKIDDAAEGANEEAKDAEGTEDAGDAQDKAENADEKTAAESGEANKGEEPKADAKTEEKPEEIKPAVDEVISVDEETAKSLPELVKAGVLKETKEAGAISLPKAVTNLIANLTNLLQGEVKKVVELEAKLAQVPEKRALAMQGQFEAPKVAEKSTEPSDGFKSLFGIK